MLDTCPRVRVRLHLDEFPWLEKLGDTALLDFVSVKRADERVMESVPWELTMSEFNGHEVRTGVMVALVDSNGKILGWVRPAIYKVDHTCSTVMVEEKGERILSACYRVGADQVYYLCWVEFGYGCFRCGSPPNWRATVYKPHKAKSYTDLADSTWTVEKVFVELMKGDVPTHQ